MTCRAVAPLSHGSHPFHKTRGGKPQQNGFIESFNGNYAPLMHVNMHCRAVDECLNETLFGTLGDARETLEEWQVD
jgi:putative transposase